MDISAQMIKLNVALLKGDCWVSSVNTSTENPLGLKLIKKDNAFMRWVYSFFSCFRHRYDNIRIAKIMTKITVLEGDPTMTSAIAGFRNTLNHVTHGKHSQLIQKSL